MLLISNRRATCETIGSARPRVNSQAWLVVAARSIARLKVVCCSLESTGTVGSFVHGPRTWAIFAKSRVADGPCRASHHSFGKLPLPLAGRGCRLANGAGNGVSITMAPGKVMRGM